MTVHGTSRGLSIFHVTKVTYPLDFGSLPVLVKLRPWSLPRLCSPLSSVFKASLKFYKLDYFWLICIIFVLRLLFWFSRRAFFCSLIFLVLGWHWDIPWQSILSIGMALRHTVTSTLNTATLNLTSDDAACCLMPGDFCFPSPFILWLHLIAPLLQSMHLGWTQNKLYLLPLTPFRISSP